MRNVPITAVFRAARCGALLAGLFITCGCESLRRPDSDPQDVRLAELLASDIPAQQIQALAELAQEPLAQDPLTQSDADSDLLKSARLLAKHPDASLRQAAIVALAKQHDSHALDLLEAATEDANLQVRTTAVKALGILRGPQAERVLLRLTSDSLAVIRGQAIRSLAEMGRSDLLREASDDSSWRVRLVVAEMLALDTSREAVQIAKQFVNSRNHLIQQQIVKTIAHWPLRLAGPLLLSAVGSDSYMTSKLAAEQLVRRWPAASILPVEPARHTNPAQLLVMKKERSDVVTRLYQLWQAEFPSDGPAQTPSAAGPNSDLTSEPAAPIKTVSPELTLRVKRLLDDLSAASPSTQQPSAAIAGLKAVGPKLPDVLEQIAADVYRKPLPDVVFREVLSDHGNVFAALDQLADDQASSRRLGAVAISKYRKHHKLTGLQLGRLSQLLTRENDPTVWLSLLDTVAGDSRPAARRLLLIAAGHPQSEVRRRGCEYLGQTHDERYQPALLLLLEDRSPAVIAAALRGLAHTGPIADKRPLIKLLRHDDTSLRLEAAATLARLGASEGRDALGRMAYDRDPRLRRRAATIMGQIGDQSFIPVLLEKLLDRTPVQQAALVSLRQITGQDFRHAADGSLASQTEQIRSWRRWHAAASGGD